MKIALHSTETTGNAIEPEEDVTKAREKDKTVIADFTKDWTGSAIITLLK